MSEENQSDLRKSFKVDVEDFIRTAMPLLNKLIAQGIKVDDNPKNYYYYQNSASKMEDYDRGYIKEANVEKKSPEMQFIDSVFVSEKFTQDQKLAVIKTINSLDKNSKDIDDKYVTQIHYDYGFNDELLEKISNLGGLENLLNMSAIKNLPDNNPLKSYKTPDNLLVGAVKGGIVHKDAIVSPNNFIEAGSLVGPGVTVKDSVIRKGAIAYGNDTIINRAILEQNSQAIGSEINGIAKGTEGFVSIDRYRTHLKSGKVAQDVVLSKQLTPEAINELSKITSSAETAGLFQDEKPTSLNILNHDAYVNDVGKILAQHQLTLTDQEGNNLPMSDLEPNDFYRKIGGFVSGAKKGASQIVGWGGPG